MVKRRRCPLFRTGMAAWILILQGCGYGSPNTRLVPQGASAIPECRAVIADGRLVRPPTEEEIRYFPLSRYARFPSGDRALLRRAEMENDECRGRMGNDSSTLRACNRGYCVALELERRGICWGGGEIAAEDRWLPCSEADSPPLTPNLPFPEEGVR